MDRIESAIVTTGPEWHHNHLDTKLVDPKLLRQIVRAIAMPVVITNGQAHSLKWGAGLFYRSHDPKLIIWQATTDQGYRQAKADPRPS